jgi:hypothetical protein
MNKVIDCRTLFSITLFLLLGVGFLVGQDDAAKPNAAESAKVSGPTDGVLSVDRAWEFRPYRVRVWVCTDGSPGINANFDRLVNGLARRAELADPSGWELLISRAPNPWAFRFPNIIEDAETQSGFHEIPEIAFDDKLMVVCLNSVGGLVHCRVREYDVLTQQWGSLVTRKIAQKTQLDATIYDMVATAFMPLARVDKVDKQNNVFMRARGVNLCERAQLNAEGEWEMVTNSGSPVYVRDDDKFLPIIRRTGRDGKLSKLEPIPFTFLTITAMQGADVETKIQSTARAPLAGRTSKRAQKLALVIRPPEEDSTLRLVSRDDETHPLEGFEVYSRYVGQVKDSPSEFLGQSDWRGEIKIPPSENGLRLILIKRGTRPLAKLPIMPGLYKRLQSTLLNDEARLNAEGIIKGLRSEVLNLVAQRAVYESQIEAELDRGNIDGARGMLDKYRALPTLDQLRSRMTDDRTRLKGQTEDKREMDYIDRMFSTLRQIIGENVGASKSTELLQRIQEAAPSN